MILGNAGIVTVIITATSSVVTSKGYALPLDIALLIAGVFVIYKIASHQGFIRRWEHYMEKKLVKHPAFDEEPVEDLLHLIEGYGLIRIIVKKDSSLIGSPLSMCKSCGDQALVLGLERGNRWIPIPHSDETMQEGDRIVVYGQLDALNDLFKE